MGGQGGTDYEVLRNALSEGISLQMAPLAAVHLKVRVVDSHHRHSLGLGGVEEDLPVVSDRSRLLKHLEDVTLALAAASCCKGKYPPCHH